MEIEQDPDQGGQDDDHKADQKPVLSQEHCQLGHPILLDDS